MSKLIDGSPLGSLTSGELFNELYKHGSLVVYRHYRTGPAYKLTLYANNQNVTARFADSPVVSKFDLAGLLHTMNDPRWECVVFTNYWFARAYAEAKIQGRPFPKDIKEFEGAYES